MSKGFTIQQLQELQKQGLIRGYELRTIESIPKGEIGLKTAKKSKSQKGQKIKNWIALNLWYWCKANNYLLLQEQEFDEERKWRLDYMICGLKVAIEYEGLNATKSRHTTLGGYTGDTDKYNALQRKGIKLLRFTALNHNNLLQELDKLK